MAQRSLSPIGGEAWRGTLQRQDRANLHGAAVGRRALGGVRDSLVLVLGFDHVEADQLVTAVDEGTWGGLGGPVADTNRFGRLRALHRVAGLEHALAVDLFEVLVE